MSSNINIAESFPKTQTIQLRNKYIGKACELFYEENPVKIIAAKGQYMYDENGECYLDCINNVAHVGHCHPDVVNAQLLQASVLNTNSRFLHDNIVVCAEKLTSLFPEPLSVCFFVNSGSEANDLALQLAEHHTKNTDIITMEHAYHGHLSSLLDLSTYKLNRLENRNKPDWVHIALCPDIYRGKYTKSDENNDTDLGLLYAEHVRELIRKAHGNGKKISAFISESLQSCGGQIIFPPNYLKNVYRYVRDAGGVCIADEVQVGFGRVGDKWWAFQLQDVIPDIVTLGKPMGNGHPVSAVITTPEIAASFANSGIGYFNTFGGNPVSCIIASTVIDIIKNENLMKNAKKVGEYMLCLLNDLKSKHRLIGDVRGVGLFIGIELVVDKFSKDPASKEAKYIVNRMKDEHIFISTDGPYKNVLKIKPPMIFNELNAENVVTKLNITILELEKNGLPLSLF